MPCHKLIGSGVVAELGGYEYNTTITTRRKNTKEHTHTQPSPPSRRAPIHKKQPPKNVNNSTGSSTSSSKKTDLPVSNIDERRLPIPHCHPRAVELSRLRGGNRVVPHVRRFVLRWAKRATWRKGSSFFGEKKKKAKHAGSQDAGKGTKAPSLWHSAALPLLGVLLWTSEAGLYGCGEGNESPRRQSSYGPTGAPGPRFSAPRAVPRAVFFLVESSLIFFSLLQLST